MKFIYIYIKIVFIKLTNWEYWPRWIVYFFSAFYYTWLVIKSKRIFFLSASNPSIYTGGMFGESKFDLYNMMPKEWQPLTLLITENTSFDALKNLIVNHKLNYPIIAKPDKGGMGWEVEKIANESDLKNYYNKHRLDFVIQEYIKLPNEYGVFYIKLPNKNEGFISSITQKIPLVVIGDGINTLEDLIINNNRAVIQYFNLKKIFRNQWHHIISNNQTIVLNSIGNHAKGAIFLNATCQSTPELQAQFSRLFSEMNQVNFARLDVKCNNLHELAQGIHFKIIEINGAGSVPTHIYHPGFSFWQGQKVLLEHLSYLYKISMYNIKNKVPTLTLKMFFEISKNDAIYRKKVLK
ncbi:MAG: hypothetical protein QM539_01140 [Alphaproteobacteria bacterium]|nr:hypothetical protein [Alphaproteobacteria bacterium]